MAFIPAVHTCRVCFEQATNRCDIINVLWFRYPAPITIAQQASLNAVLIAWWRDCIRWIQHTEIAFRAVRNAIQDSETGHVQVTEYVTPGMVSGATPTNAALVCTLGTGIQGRSFRGRFYLGGIPYQNLEPTEPSLVTTAYLGYYLGAMSVIPAYLAIDGHGAELVIASHYANGEPRETAVLTPVSSYTANRQVDSQKRRLRLGSLGG